MKNTYNNYKYTWCLSSLLIFASWTCYLSIPCLKTCSVALVAGRPMFLNRLWNNTRSFNCEHFRATKFFPGKSPSDGITLIVHETFYTLTCGTLRNNVRRFTKYWHLYYSWIKRTVIPFILWQIRVTYIVTSVTFPCWRFQLPQFICRLACTTHVSCWTHCWVVTGQSWYTRPSKEFPNLHPPVFIGMSRANEFVTTRLPRYVLLV